MTKNICTDRVMWLELVQSGPFQIWTPVTLSTRQDHQRSNKREMDRTLPYLPTLSTIQRQGTLWGNLTSKSKDSRYATTLRISTSQRLKTQAEVDYSTLRIQCIKVISLGSAVPGGASSYFVDNSVLNHRSRQGAWPKVNVIYIMAISSASRVPWIAVRAGSKGILCILQHCHHDHNVFGPPWSHCSCITTIPGSSQ